MSTEIIEKSAQLDERAVAAKQSKYEIEQLIESFKPFLHSKTAKYSFGYDKHQREEMFSIAMLAFYESIQSYDAEKGHFFPFANNVVSKRIIDHIRKLYRHDGKTLSLEEQDEENTSVQSAAIEKLSIQLHTAQCRQKLLVDEIEQYKEELRMWGITMDSLVSQSPKHKKLRDEYRGIIELILKNPDIIQTIQLKHYFPVKSVSEISGFPQKKLERARIFILASLIIKMGDYELLSDYVDFDDRRKPI